METFETRRTVVFARQCLLDTETMMESTGPKTRFKIRSCQESTQGVTNPLMRAFHRTVLMGGIGTSRTNVMSKLLEKCTNLWVIMKLTTLVQANTLVLDKRQVADEPLAPLVHGSTFVDADGAVKGAGEVIFDV
jgi:hypothetical protein